MTHVQYTDDTWLHSSFSSDPKGTVEGLECCLEVVEVWIF